MHDTLPMPQRALLLVYDEACEPCGHNIPRWLDLIAAAREQDASVKILLVDIGRGTPDPRYWRGLEHVAQRIKLDSAAASGDYLRAQGTPSTVVVQDGQVELIMGGFLGDKRRAAVLASLRPRSTQ
jgi:hypothetical protein